VLLRTDQNMDGAKTNAEKAHTEIQGAQKHQTSGNKWLCYILIVLCVIAVIISVLVVATH
jgi:t-SNARE complex subunit (syntaxin)